jgi:hypothetical protein
MAVGEDKPILTAGKGFGQLGWMGNGRVELMESMESDAN